MLIYFCLIIPLIAVAVLAWKYHSRMSWWEYLVVFGVPALCIGTAKIVSTMSQTSDTEIWNSYLTKATYYEDWDEWIHKTCYHTCYEECRDSEGHTYQCNPHDCNPYDCSYREYHPEYWEAFDNLGNSFYVDKIRFERLCATWANKSFQDMNRRYYTDDGDAYNTVFTGELKDVIPRTIQFTYENRVKCSRSLFNFEDVDSADIKDYGLYDYPKVSEFDHNPILGWNDPAASLRLQQYNALLGSKKQVYMLILVYKDKPVQAALYQEGYWKGGNKNEFILCIGVRSNKIDWAKVISWTEVDELKIGVEKKVVSMDMNLMSIVDYMTGEVNRKFIRKQFKDFSYITVEPTITALWVTFLITIVVTVGLSVYCVLNQFEEE